MTLEKGNPAPGFETRNQNGEIIKLTDFKGKKLVLYFYPRDNTPKCTDQACNLRDNYDRFLAKGMSVLGISTDSEKKHKNFIKKFQLPFDLLVDEDHKISEDYGVWGLKTLYGRQYMGIVRTTFIIDEKGVISEIITTIDAKDHTNQLI